MSVAAYQKANQNAENPRQTEYRAFAIFTRAMEEVEEDDLVGRVKAVANNQRLWITLQKDLLLENNSLPNELKAQLLSIAFWVSRYSRQAMKGEAALDPLITVNKQIMDGLKGNPSQQISGDGTPTASPGDGNILL
ncbi:MAG: flagellar biosynthesis regulatory protein FlaF [Alphaproteobacteria bacterium]|nr:MAG: flagellar biosynthesis regulatory protein FlaF [Alphaproteobacteria bacterium]